MPRDSDIRIILATHELDADYDSTEVSTEAWICGDCSSIVADIDKHREASHPELTDLQVVEAAIEKLQRAGSTGLSLMNLVKIRNRWGFAGDMNKEAAVRYARTVLNADR